jgi:hypothetical protein
MSTTQILWILDVGTLLSIGVGIWTALTRPEKTDAEALDRSQRDTRSDARSPSCRGIPLHRSIAFGSFGARVFDHGPPPRDGHLDEFASGPNLSIVSCTKRPGQRREIAID